MVRVCIETYENVLRGHKTDFWFVPCFPGRPITEANEGIGQTQDYRFVFPV
jgi:hypothetical protein